MKNDISAACRISPKDSHISRELLAYEKTPEAIKFFARRCGELTPYTYWFLLSTLWVFYSGWSDLDLWIKLFSSKRPLREEAIMKPSELEHFKTLPDFIMVYRAHRIGETVWISYTLLPSIAARFARERSVNVIHEYRVSKRDVLALFLRRQEFEVLVLDNRKPVYQRAIQVGEE